MTIYTELMAPASLKSRRIASLIELTEMSIDEEIVSFDIFDTLVRRHFLNLNEVHDTVSAYALVLLKEFENSNPGELTLTRQTTTDFMKASQSFQTREPKLEDVWRRILAAQVENADELDQIITKVLDFELAIERRNLRLFHDTVTTLQNLSARGKTLVATSDMYFTRAQLAVLLDSLGILQYFKEVFVSAELNLTKQKGDLFPHVCKSLAARPSDIVHIGDNRHSDIKMARGAGLSVVLFEPRHIQPAQHPAYGKRNVYLEIADLNKLFLLSVLLNTRSHESEKLYFLARDGCLIQNVLKRWDSWILKEFLPPPPSEVIFLNRVTTCWGAINFEGEWLAQAVGFAFWLNHGRATGKQIAQLLGIDAVPISLGERIYETSLDTLMVVEALAKEGLEAPIKAALLKKRQMVMSYLQDVGFFDKKHVTFCDVGYSGTVVRDLNLFFLQDVHPGNKPSVPEINLHLISANRNFRHNSIVARPYARFSNHVILPDAALPQDLVDSFAWLEVFFKHPTFGPVRGYIERDGKTVPEIGDVPSHGGLFPSEMVADRVVSDDSDIVLLWMASQRFWYPFTNPFIERFAKPDVDTVRQMSDDVYEDDAVTGRLRSILLIDREIADEDLYSECRKRDYWIPGSRLATDLARENRNLETEQNKEYHNGAEIICKKSRAPALAPKSYFSQIMRRVSRTQSIRELDVKFYRAFYADLATFSNDALRHHYSEYGFKEQRFRSEGDMERRLAIEYGPLPIDFDREIYLSLHGDLRSGLPTPLHATRHYLEHGRHEKRVYRREWLDLDRGFENLVVVGSLVLNAKEIVLRSRGVSVREIFFKRHNMTAGRWIDYLVPAEFIALNPMITNGLDSRAACVKAFVEQGVDICAPLSFDAMFDHELYCQTMALMDAAPKDAYQHWLKIGCNRGVEPNGSAVLSHMLEQGNPDAIDWKGYAEAAKLPEISDRKEVIEAFLQSVAPDRERFVIGPTRASFLEFLARRAKARNAFDEATFLFKKALDAGGPIGVLHHQLGDLFYERQVWPSAVRHYLIGAANIYANRWSFINGARAALRNSQIKTALEFVENGRSTWSNLKPWREVRDEVYLVWFETHLRALEVDDVATSALSERIHKLIAEAVERLSRDQPAPFDGRSANGPVVVLTGSEVSGRGRSEARAGILVFRQVDGGSQKTLQALMGASLVVFHEVKLDAQVLAACLTARSFRVPSLAWFGRLATFDGIDLSEVIWTDQMDASSRIGFDPNVRDICFGVLCDRVITTCPGLASTIARTNANVKVQTVYTDSIATLDHKAAESTVIAVFGFSPPHQAGLTQSLRKILRGDTRVRLLIDKVLPEADGLREFGERIVCIDLADDIGLIAPLLQNVDGVVDIQTNPSGFEFHAEASALGIPSLVVRMHHQRLEKTDLSIECAVAQFSSSFLSLLRRARITRRGIPYGSVQPLCVPLAGTPLSRPNRKKVLIVNVYFPPQSIGGAARVVKDNIDYFVDATSNEYDFAVLSSDTENHRTGEMTCETYRGVPVFRIATPQEMHMDWRPTNIEIGSLTRRVLDIVKPDLVHIHCLQRLSASVAEECLAAHLKTIVTLHDAWWISDFAFLTDHDGFVRLPNSRLEQQGFDTQIGAARSLARGSRLRAILAAVDRRMAVSASFADIYKRCGIDCDVMENGVPAFKHTPRSKRVHERVQLCHVGGMERHKGAYLVKAALLSHKFKNLAFTIVELGREKGDELHTIWGNTPVTVLGKISSESMSQFYADMDVLLAPSTWPESYGLVSREALANGLWVIASDNGAMGDCIVEGQNGFKIDVSDSMNLLAVLNEIDAAPARYKVRPPVFKMKTSAEQSASLVKLYRELLASEE